MTLHYLPFIKTGHKIIWNTTKTNGKCIQQMCSHKLDVVIPCYEDGTKYFTFYYNIHKWICPNTFGPLKWGYYVQTVLSFLKRSTRYGWKYPQFQSAGVQSQNNNKCVTVPLLLELIILWIVCFMTVRPSHWTVMFSFFSKPLQKIGTKGATLHIGSNHITIGCRNEAVSVPCHFHVSTCIREKKSNSPVKNICCRNNNAAFIRAHHSKTFYNRKQWFLLDRFR